MTKDNKHQKLSDSTDTAIADSTCYAQFFRYECQEYASHDYDGELIASPHPHPKLELRTYDLLQETEKGYWIGYIGFSFKKWIPKKSKRRYAYPTKEEALQNFIKRTKRRVNILERQIECCKISISLAERYNESNLETMARMPDNLIDLTVTSPPYDNLRTCEKDSLTCGEFEDIVKELWRITKDGGVKKAWEEKI